MVVEHALHAPAAFALDGRVLAVGALRTGGTAAPQQVEAASVTRTVHALRRQLHGTVARLRGVTPHGDHGRATARTRFSRPGKEGRKQGICFILQIIYRKKFCRETPTKAQPVPLSGEPPTCHNTKINYVRKLY